MLKNNGNYMFLSSGGTHKKETDYLKIVGLFGLCYFSSLWIALLVADGSLGAGVETSGISDTDFSA